MGFDWMNPHILAMQKVLDGLALRQEVIANNLANVNTPGFKRAVVSFEQELQSALKHRDVRSLYRVEPQITVQSQTSLRPDGNNVDIDMEMAELAANTLQYNAVARLLSGQFGLLRSAITEGRR